MRICLCKLITLNVLTLVFIFKIVLKWLKHIGGRLSKQVVSSLVSMHDTPSILGLTELNVHYFTLVHAEFQLNACMYKQNENSSFDCF